MSPLMVKIDEAARMLSLSEKRVRDLAHDGVLEKKYTGTRHYLLTVASLERYVESLSSDPVAS